MMGSTEMVNDYVKIDHLIDVDLERAYYKCKKMYEADPSLKNDLEFLWRFSKVCVLWANGLKKRNPKRRDLIFEGRDYAMRAYQLNRNSYDALRWTAILCGAATDYLGVKDRIEQAQMFRGYLDKAIAIDPNEYTLLHLRGRFNYEISNLSCLERKVCSSIFSTLPESTTDDALCDFLEAEKNNANPWAENMLYIARCYAIKNQKGQADEFLRKAIAVGDKNEGIREGINEVRAMIAKLN